MHCNCNVHVLTLHASPVGSECVLDTLTTRPPGPECPNGVTKLISHGAGSREGLWWGYKSPTFRRLCIQMAEAARYGGAAFHKAGVRGRRKAPRGKIHAGSFVREAYICTRRGRSVYMVPFMFSKNYKSFIHDNFRAPRWSGPFSSRK